MSGRHALVTWTTTGWILKDTSTHGTVVNGSIVVKGVSRPLEATDELTFVENDEVWELADASPPGLVLEPIERSDTRSALHVAFDDGLFAFPSASAPEQTILRVGDSWFVESESGVRRDVVDGATVTLGGIGYRAFVPRRLTATAEPENPISPLSLANAELDIVVHRGEDEAEAVVRCGAIRRNVKASRPLYLLAYLAEHRLRASVEDGGWVPTDLACADLGVERTVLNVEVHRVREALKATGLPDAVNIIERRPNQMRIGVASDRCKVERR